MSKEIIRYCHVKLKKDLSISGYIETTLFTRLFSIKTPIIKSVDTYFEDTSGFFVKGLGEKLISYCNNLEPKHREHCGKDLMECYHNFTQNPRCQVDNPYHMYPYFRCAKHRSCDYHESLAFVFAVGKMYIDFFTKLYIFSKIHQDKIPGVGNEIKTSIFETHWLIECLIEKDTIRPTDKTIGMSGYGGKNIIGLNDFRCEY